MPALANQRWERFAQELAKGKSADAAYREAGYKPNDSNASRLTGNERVAARIAELKARAAVRVEITLEKLQAMAERAYEAAFDLGQIGAAVSAVKELGVLSGYRVEKRENTNRNLNEMTDDELAAIASAGGRGVAETPVRPALTH